MKHNCFFIIGAGRSGTTSISNILNTANNSEVYSEQHPKLCIGARFHYNNCLPYPSQFIYNSKNKEIENSKISSKVYGDKNQHYIHFIKEIRENWASKFVFVVRNGKDVVRSLMDFNNHRGPIYGRYEDGINYKLTQPEDDFWDFSRLRPKIGDRCYSKWREMSRFEKCCWYWSNYNSVMLEIINQLNDDEYTLIDTNNLDIQNIKDTFEFLELTGFDEKLIKKVIAKKTNKTTNLENRFPKSDDWSDEQNLIFDRLSKDMMIKLSYY